MLSRDIKEAEDQLTTAIRSHLANIDTLIDLQGNRLSALQRQFESDVGELEGEFTTERYGFTFF